MENIILSIQNLKCNGCATTITNQLGHLKSIDNCKVNTEEGSVSFDYIDEMALSKAKETLKKIGYPIVGEDNPIATKATSYISCAIGKMSK